MPSYCEVYTRYSKWNSLSSSEYTWISPHNNEKHHSVPRMRALVSGGMASLWSGTRDLPRHTYTSFPGPSFSFNWDGEKLGLVGWSWRWDAAAVIYSVTESKTAEISKLPWFLVIGAHAQTVCTRPSFSLSRLKEKLGPGNEAKSYRAHATSSTGAVAAMAEEKKVLKYSCLAPTHTIVPIAIGTQSLAFLKDLGSRIRQQTGEERAGHNNSLWQCRGGTQSLSGVQLVAFPAVYLGRFCCCFVTYCLHVVFFCCLYYWDFSLFF